MAINRESNAYTIIFAIVMVSVVGGVLAFIATSLKPVQKANVINEKMQNILQAMGDSTLADVSRKEAGALFSEYVTDRIILDYDGNIKNGCHKKMSDPIVDTATTDAFNVDIRKEYVSVPDVQKRNYPLFVCEKGGHKCFVVSFSGKGLWDDIWGYFGISSNGVDVVGAVFDHKGETPGLGSKIAEDWFEQSFIGKKIAANGKFAPIKVQKPGGSLNDHTVDGISGGTFTSAGVTEMLKRTLVVYYNFFQSEAGKEFLK